MFGIIRFINVNDITVSGLAQLMNNVDNIINMNPVHKHIGYKYYTGDTVPSNILGEDNDLYFITSE